MSKNSRRNKAKGLNTEAFVDSLVDAAAPVIEEKLAALTASGGRDLPPEAVERMEAFTRSAAAVAAKICSEMIAAGVDPSVAGEVTEGFSADIVGLCNQAGELAVMAAELKKAEKAEEAPAAGVAEKAEEAAAVIAEKAEEAVLVETRSSARVTWAKGMPINNIDDALAWREMKIAEWRQSRA